ncbi:hypothetical protein BJ875DRAFT_85174 [Amylocarpus encephaloides]|uniref:Uncharacterized protein n=1 Tax=Amylocarpus encephaloides TaxID=45428 RepID=A0A9P7YTS2_9HELO|nr:hypothetical protein BJ875DRAFT_85174 [Amylocarpus encephaloides]
MALLLLLDVPHGLLNRISLASEGHQQGPTPLLLPLLATPSLLLACLDSALPSAQCTPRSPPGRHSSVPSTASCVRRYRRLRPCWCLSLGLPRRAPPLAYGGIVVSVRAGVCPWGFPGDRPSFMRGRLPARGGGLDERILGVRGEWGRRHE